MRRSTIIYLVLFALVLGAAYYINNRPKPADIESTAEPAAPTEYLFTSADGLPSRIRVESNTGEIVEVDHNEENAWVMTQPEEAAADQGSVEAAAGQVSTMRVLEHISNLAPDAVGLDDPEYTITLQFTSGVERIVKIGVLTPTESGYYIPGENGEILIVSRSSVDSLTGLLTNLPFAPTEVPAPTSTP